MKICVAQLRPVSGAIRQNIDKHRQLIDLAVTHKADVIIFPELSITGYEPEQAYELATTQDDSRFAIFQQISDASQITIGVGMPIKSDQGIQIGMVIFQPRSPRQTYAKQYLHTDEYPYFVSGQYQVFLQQNSHILAPAICYELSVPEHSAHAFQNGADVYLVSVAKSAGGVEKAADQLSAIARNYAMNVLMANCVGHCDNFEAAGQSAIWNNQGELLGQLDKTSDGLLMIDTTTQTISRLIAPDFKGF